MTATTNKIVTTKTTKTIETISNATTSIRHALSSKGKKTTNNKKLHKTNHSKSDDEIFALEEKCNINNDDQNIITKQDYVPEIAIGVLALCMK